MQANITIKSLGYQQPDGTHLFTNLSASFGAERTGLVGPNGAGKSTLLSLLGGMRTPSAGSIAVHGRICFHPQASPETDHGTIADVLGVAGTLRLLERAQRGDLASDELASLEGKWDLEERLRAAFAQSGISSLTYDMAMNRLSGGERVRVRFAGLLLAEAEFLLLDEPTNHLDRSGREAVYALVTSWRRGLLVASHDRELLGYVTQIAELDNGTLRLYGGNYAAYRQQKDIEIAAGAQAVQAARESLEKAKILAAQSAERQSRRSVRARKDFLVHGGMPKILAGKRKRKAEETTGRLSDVHGQRIAGAEKALRTARENHQEDAPLHWDLASPDGKGARSILRFENVGVQFPDRRELWPKKLALEIRRGERVALRGANGSGKTIFLKLVAGIMEPTEGRVVRQSKQVVYLDQHTEVLQPGSVLENAQAYAKNRSEGEIRVLLARMGLPNEAVFKDTRVLSGGERVRAAFACLLIAEQAPDLLLLDEPDNHLDLQAMLIAADALRQFRGTLLVVSHDTEFLKSLGLEREVVL